jgi:hypothetical protein
LLPSLAFCGAGAGDDGALAGIEKFLKKAGIEKFLKKTLEGR